MVEICSYLFILYCLVTFYHFAINPLGNGQLPNIKSAYLLKSLISNDQEHLCRICNLQKMFWLCKNQKTQSTEGESVSTLKLSCLKKNVPEDTHFLKSAVICILYITCLGQITFLIVLLCFQFLSLCIF